jgi:hypothetical protein
LKFDRNDGGIKPETKNRKRRRATILVAGNYIFKNGKGDGKDEERYRTAIESSKKHKSKKKITVKVALVMSLISGIMRQCGRVRPCPLTSV